MEDCSKFSTLGKITILSRSTFARWNNAKLRTVIALLSLRGAFLILNTPERDLLERGRAGQGRAGQGRAGQGRAGQGRAGQGSGFPSKKAKRDTVQTWQGH